MKLPEEIKAILPRTSDLEQAGINANYETIVRDCAKVCEQESNEARAKYNSAEAIGSAVSMAISASAGMAASRIRSAILSRYGLGSVE